jgi:hypothetical protein
MAAFKCHGVVSNGHNGSIADGLLWLRSRNADHPEHAFQVTDQMLLWQRPSAATLERNQICEWLLAGRAIRYWLGAVPKARRNMDAKPLVLS